MFQQAVPRVACALPRMAPARHLSSSAARQSSSSSSPKPASGVPTQGGLDMWWWGGASGAGGMFAGLKSMFRKRPSAGWLAESHLLPRQAESPDGSGFRTISFGHAHAAFVTGNGALYVFGEGKALGLGESTQSAPTPRLVEGLPRVRDVRCGQSHTLVLSEEGEVFVFGSGGGMLDMGAIGRKGEAWRPERLDIDGGKRVAAIAAGSKHCLVLSEEGQCFSWGNGEHGRLGDGSSSGHHTPELIVSLAESRVQQIACGSSFNGAVDAEGRAWMWGRAEKGQLGQGVGLTLDQYALESSPVRVPFPGEDEAGASRTRIAKLACGYKHTLAIDQQGRLWAWGQDFGPQPLLLRGDDAWLLHHRFASVAGGSHFSHAAMDDGSLISWGSGAAGCLGHGDKRNWKHPCRVKGFGPDLKTARVESDDKWRGRVKHIVAGHNHVAVFTSKAK